MARFGKVQDLTKEFNFEWRIEDFLSLGEGAEISQSPTFSFAGESWSLCICPNGPQRNDSVSSGYIGLYLLKESSDSDINLTGTFSLKTIDGKKGKERECSVIMKDKAAAWGTIDFMKRSELLEKKSELLPSNALTIIFSVTDYSKCNEEADITSTNKCSHCEKSIVSECASTHEQKCLEKPIRCSTCSDVVTLRNWFDHECPTLKVKANEKLVKDLAALINSEERSDVTIKVKDKEFRLHWSILGGRNSYFNSMVKAEMKEVATGFITIHDCEPDIFHSFINFLYTGKLETLSSDNVCALYKVADKYQEDQVKAECLNFMKKKISVENFCDFVALSLTHDEKELLQDATEFFCKNVREIIKSVKWQTFMREYPTEANELNLKAFDFYLK